MSKSSKKNTIHIIDVTLREGSYLLNFQITPAQTSNITEYLDHANISHIEIGHGSGLGAIELGYPAAASDLEYLEASKQATKKAKLGMLVNPICNSFTSYDEILTHLDFARIACNVYETANVHKIFDKVKKHDLLTFFQLTRTPTYPPFRVAPIARQAKEMGADVIYIVDSMGSLSPKLVREYVEAIKEEVDAPLGFHAHNNLGLAIANTLEAIRAGCTWVDASILGVGRQAGNTQLETLVLLLQKEGYDLDIDVSLLLNMAESIVAPIFNSYKGIDPFDVLAASYNLDLFPKWQYQNLALMVGLDTVSFIQELANIKNFMTLSNEDRLVAISKKFNIPYTQLANAVQTLPEFINLV